MLEQIRERTKGWVAVCLFSVLALALVGFGLQYYMHGGASDAVAVVGGHAISKAELERAIRQKNQPRSPELKKQVLINLIQRQAWLSKLLDNDFSFSRQAINKELIKVPQFQREGVFSRPLLNRYLQMSQQTPLGFMRTLQNDQMIQQFNRGVIRSGFVLDYEREIAYRLSNQTRSAVYVTVPVEKALEGWHLDHKKVESYYQANQLSFAMPAKVKLAYVVLAPKNMKAQVVVTDQQIEQYYQEHYGSMAAKGAIPAKLKVQIKTALRQNERQKKWSVALAQLSNISFTHPDQLQTVATALGLQVKKTLWMAQAGPRPGIFKNNQLWASAWSSDVLDSRNNSQPITLNDGSVAVVRVLAYQAKKIPPMTDVLPRIKKALRAQAQQNNSNTILVKLDQEILSTGKSLAQLAPAMQLTIHHVKPIKISNLSLSKKLVRSIYAVSWGEHENLKLFQLTPAHPALLQVTSAVLPAKEPSAAQKKAWLAELDNYDSNAIYQAIAQNAWHSAKIQIIRHTPQR